MGPAADSAPPAPVAARTSASLDLAAFVRAVREATQHEGALSLHEPEFAGNEWAYVKECLDSTIVSYAGPFVDRLERDLADFTGAAHCLVTVNGTAALHLALKLLGVERGDEVLVPTLTFVATANAISYCAAIPHLVDVERRTLGVDVPRLAAYLEEVGERKSGALVNRQSGRRIRALLPMHTFGHPTDMDPLLELAERHGLVVLEDSANGLGSTYKGRHLGTLGRAGIISFNGNKVITTGGGGALLTNDDELATRARHLATTGKLPHPWAYVHDEVAYNYRMPNLNAALGCAQLERVPDLVRRKRELAARYRSAFQAVAGVESVDEPEFAHSNYWLCAVLLADGGVEARDAVLRHTHDDKIGTRPVWSLLHHLPMYDRCPRMELPVAEHVAAHLINLPSSAQLMPPHA